MTWVAPVPRAHPALRLFCIPYAGGSEAVFRHWSDELPDYVEVRALSRPGFGSRLLEAPIPDFHYLVRITAAELVGECSGPFVLFGHSLGALIAFEIARLLENDRAPVPQRLIVSGASAPHCRKLRAPTHRLTDDQFVQHLRHLNGTPPEMFEAADLVELLLPGLRTDFRFADEYVHSPGRPLSTPIDVFSGSEDKEVDTGSLSRWAQLTTRACSISVIEGGHLFLNTNQDAFFHALRSSLMLRSQPYDCTD